MDTCGGDDCPAELPLDNSATLMSYCKFCDGENRALMKSLSFPCKLRSNRFRSAGGLDNVALTFGGSWDGEGPKDDISSWATNPQLVESAVTTDARRVSHRVWTALSSKGECILPATEAPTAAPTGSPTTPAPTTRPPSYFPDQPEDGRVWTRPGSHCMEAMKCASAPGIMFDIGLDEVPSSSYGIFLESIQFEHVHYNATVVLYSIEGSHVGKERQDSSQAAPRSNETLVGSSQNISEWSKIAVVSVSELDSFTEIVLSEPLWMPPGAARGFYLVAAAQVENFFVVGVGPSPSEEDANGVSIGGGTVVFDTFGQSVTGFYPTTLAGYTVVPPPTASPVTSSPSSVPSAVPSLHPSSQPTPLPTIRPTPPPSSSPVGPFSISAEQTCVDTCRAVPGYMFSVKNKIHGDAREVVITAISFEHLAATQSKIVELYRTVSGSHSGNEQDSSQWIKIESVKAPRRDFAFTDFVLGAPITLAKGEAVGFYIKTQENILLVGKDRQGIGETTADNVKLSYGCAVTDGMFGTITPQFYWNGAVTYYYNAS